VLRVNQNIQRVEPSATIVINERSNDLVKSGRKVYKLGFGQSPFPVPKSVVKALRKNAHQKDYLPVKGLYELRKAVANHQSTKIGLSCEAEDVIIGPGSKELLYLTQLIYNGDLLLPRPSWVSYAPQAKIVGKKQEWLETKKENGYLLHPDTLSAYCLSNPYSPKLLLLNYPSNPTGATYTESQLKALAGVAKKYNILVLSDEIYGDVHHEGQHISISQFYPEGTIVSGGLSKWCGAGGWRLGTFIFPKEYRWLLDKMGIIASETFTSTSAPIQYAAVRAYKGGKKIDKYLKDSRYILDRVANECHRLLTDFDIECPNPKGGFYLMPDFEHYRKKLAARGIHTSHDLCEAILEETGVALLPLSAFGMDEKVLGVRLSYVDFDGKRALKIRRKNKKAPAKKLAPKVIKGIHLIGDWINNI